MSPEPTETRRALFPFVFTYRDKVFGDTFAVEVTMRGRVLGAKEGPEEIWMYGVQPGSVAAWGKNEAEAHTAFRNEYRAVLFDIAADAKTFEEFRAEVETFFGEIAEPVQAEWRLAVEEVRAGRIGSDLPKESAESPTYVRIERKTHFTARDNSLEAAPALAA